MYKLNNQNIDLILNQYITPLKREIIKNPMAGQIVPIPKQNYNSYNLFVLRTRLRSLIQKIWNRDDIDVKIATIPYKNNMHIKVEPTLAGEELNMSNQQKRQFGKILLISLKEDLDYAVAISEQTIKTPNLTIPKHYVAAIIPYIQNPETEDEYIKYRIGKYGYEVLCYGGPDVLGGDTNNLKYRVYYNYIESEATNELIKYYKNGYIVNPTKQVISEWSLIKVQENMYKPSWRDQRITKPYRGVYPFLESRLLGDTDVKLYVGTNLVDYHYISKQIRDSYFGNGYLHLNVNNLKQAMKSADIIDNITFINDKVAVFKITGSHMSIYEKICKDMNLNDISYYHRADLLGYSFYMSIGLDSDHNEQIVTNEIKTRALKLIELED